MNLMDAVMSKDIHTAVSAAIAIAKRENSSVTFKFYGIELAVAHDDCAADIVLQFEKKLTATREYQMRKFHDAPLPAFKMRNEASWKATVFAAKDERDMQNVRAAATWAYLMEQLLANGSQLKDIADSTLTSTNESTSDEDISFLRVNYLLGILARHWTHGRQLVEYCTRWT